MFKKVLFVVLVVFVFVVNVGVVEFKEFCVGIFGGENQVDCLCNYVCFQDNLKKEFGFEKVLFFLVVDYDGVIQGLFGGMFDFVEFGVFGFVNVYFKNVKVVMLILMMQQKDGLMGYYLIGFVLKFFGIKIIQDVKGKKFGYVDLDFILGYFVLLIQILKDIGVLNDKFFLVMQFNGGYENNLFVVYDGKVDVVVDDVFGIGDFVDGFIFGMFYKLVVKGKVDLFKFVEVWCLLFILNGLFVVCNEFGQEWQVKFVKFFIDLLVKDVKCFSVIEGGDFKGYVLVMVDNYKVIIEVCKQVIGG